MIPAEARAGSRSTLRVLVVIENVSIARDHRARKQIETLRGAGCDVALICRRDVDNRRVCDLLGVTLYQFPAPPESSLKIGFVVEYGFALLASWVLAAVCFVRHRFDVIQVGGPPDILFLIAWPFRLFGRQLIVDQRDLSLEVFETRYGPQHPELLAVVRFFERASWRAADQVLTVNGTLRERICERSGIAPDSVTIVGNGPRLAPAAEPQQRSDLRLGKQFLIAWLGLMGPQDYVEYALDAAAYIVHELHRDDCHFVFIGDGESLPDLLAMCKQLGLTDTVTFTGWLQADAVAEHLDNCDLAMDTNMQAEVSPVKGMEYMAHGVPFVAFDLRETRVMAEDAAAYVAPGDSSGLGRALNDLLDDEPSRVKMGVAGKRRVRDRLAWEHQAVAYLAAYDSLRLRRGDPNSTTGVRSATRRRGARRLARFRAHS
jgi:glycosyltransferase involved in cell wall biosynthesis